MRVVNLEMFCMRNGSFMIFCMNSDAVTIQEISPYGRN